MLEAFASKLGISFAASTAPVGAEVLWPEERVFVERACAKRVADFAAGRDCARRALGALGVPPGPLLVAPTRAPVWPTGYVGSITHTAGYAAAVAAPTSRFLGLGIDAEVVDPARMVEGMQRLILRPEEHGLAAEVGGGDAAKGAFLLFAAKEALYKCLFPVVQRFFGFEDAEVEAVDDEGGWFSVRLATSLGRGLEAGVALEGRFARAGDLVATLVPWEGAR